MIKLNDLAIGYNGEAILEHIDQEFDDGLIYGILAKSGAGKTTLLKTIAGLLRPVHGTLNRFVGEQSSVQKNLNKLYGELKDVESKCESLVRSGNMADAAIFSTRREEILFEISQKEGYLRELEPMVKEAQTVYEAYDKKLRELKKQSRMTVEEMKLRGNMKDLLGDLDELRRDSATDKLLGSVRDGAEDLRKEVDGAIVVHASRTTTKMSMAEKNAAKAQSDAYLQSLATKYSGKPAIQAPRSGVTFDAPKSKVKEERK